MQDEWLPLPDSNKKKIPTLTTSDSEPFSIPLNNHSGHKKIINVVVACLKWLLFLRSLFFTINTIIYYEHHNHHPRLDVVLQHE